MILDIYAHVVLDGSGLDYSGLLPD